MKKLVSIILVLVMVLSLAACGPTNNPDTTTKPNVDLAGTYKIKVWVAENIVDLTKTQIDNFNKTNKLGITFEATVEPVGESDAATSMTTDVEAGADIFCFAQDQTARLIQAGALAPLGQAAAELVKNSHDKASVGAVTAGDKLYGYPLTSDNGYFMYYDKSVIPETAIGNMTDLIAAAKAAGRNISFELENSWYIVSYFFGAGCISEWETDGDGKFIKVNDNFNSETGLIAAKGMQELLTSGIYVNSSATADFDAAVKSAVVVSGTWNYENAKSILGDNLGIAELPSFTVDGKDYHLGSYNGCKLMGVKPQSDAKRAAALHQLAQYMTSEEVQLERFNAVGWGPSNVKAQASDAVKAAPHLTALIAQNAYSRPQGQIHGSWWDIAKVIATSIKEGGELQAALDTYKASMDALFTMSDDVLKAWTVIGTIGGSNWTDDLPMTEQADGTWKSNEAYDIGDADEFKVRQGKSWTNNYGMNDDGTPALDGPNATLAKMGKTAGKYYVVLNPADGTISLVAA